MSQNWLELKNSANQAMADNDLNQALMAWQSALMESEKFSRGDGRHVESLEGLALSHLEKGNFTEAESYFKKALMERESQQGADHQDVATLLNNLGTVYFKRGFYKDALVHFERALNVRRKVFTNEHIEVGRVLYHLALTCHAQKRYDEADGHYRKALDIKNKTLGNNHPDLIGLLRNYAHLLRKTSRDSIARQMEQFASGIEAKQKAS
jgi:tetratricopeptide (TPR) repeat protein